MQTLQLTWKCVLNGIHFLFAEVCHKEGGMPTWIALLEDCQCFFDGVSALILDDEWPNHLVVYIGLITRKNKGREYRVVL